MVFKDNKTVADYNIKRRLEIFKGQCFNNACLIIATFHGKDVTLFDDAITQEVYVLSDKL